MDLLSYDTVVRTPLPEKKVTLFSSFILSNYRNLFGGGNERYVRQAICEIISNTPNHEKMRPEMIACVIYLNEKLVNGKLDINQVERVINKLKKSNDSKFKECKSLSMATVLVQYFKKFYPDKI